jgi:hypothetical protein
MSQITHDEAGRPSVRLMASWGRSDKLYNITAFGYEFARHAASEMRRMLLPCVGRA